MNHDKVTTGLKQNWRQFSLLVLINAFVDGMVGLERTIQQSPQINRFQESCTII